MRKLVITFIKYPFYANLIIAVLLIGGIISFAGLKKSFFPERESREIIITVTYPGASPKQMEEGITTRIEEAVRSIVGIKEITSTSSENFARVVVTTTGEYDIDVTVQEIKNAVDGISSFPTAAERPIIFKQRSTTPALFMALAGENVSLITLKEYIQDIEDDFRASGIMSQINISGYPDFEISVEVNEDDLLRYQLTMDELSQAIARNNTDISGGRIKSKKEELLIRARERSVNPDDIGNIIIRANSDGSFLRINDVATVKQQFADVSNLTLLNGERAVFMQIQKLGEEDLQEISEYVNNYVKKFNAEHTGLKLYVTFDFLDLLQARLNLLYSNGGIGLMLVLIALGLFLSLRLSFWVAFGIPASFLGMFIIAGMYGITINMISLFGMILVIGILVDDGIVIAENIYSHFEKGKSPKQAAVDGTMEVLPAVTTSVTTTIVAFSPLLLLKQGGLEFLFEMAFVVIFSLLFSLIEAFFVLPVHVGNKHVLRSSNRTAIGNKVRGTLAKGVDWLRFKIYGRVLKTVIRWRWVMLFIPIALIIITVGLFRGGQIQSTFFPVIPFDNFNINIAFTPGSGEAQTMEYLKRFEESVWEVNDELMEEHQQQLQALDDTIPIVRFTLLNLGNAFNGVETGSHAGNIFVLLRNLENTGVSSFEVVERIREKIGNVPEANKFAVGGQNRFGAPVSISLLSKSLEELNQAEQFMTDKLKAMDDIEDIVNTNAAGKREVRLHLKPNAYFLGLDHAAVNNQVRNGFFGGQAQRLQDGKDELRVWVRYPPEDTRYIGQLENMKIKTALGEYPLTEIADYSIERGPVSIKHYNLKREVRIEAELVDPYAPVPPVLNKIRNTIIPELKGRFPGVSTEFQGQQRRGAESSAEMKRYFSVAFLIILALVMLHFRSAIQGIFVILMIPLAWLGAAWGHGLEGMPISMLSAWGMVALTGVIINDAVVFLAKYNLFLTEGKNVVQSAYLAGLARFRAIVLTTITTTVGLYPIILEKSFQAQFLKPMAAALAYGVLIGTGFILLFFPVVISVTSDIKVFFKWLLTGEKVSPESLEKAIIDKNKKELK